MNKYSRINYMKEEVVNNVLEMDIVNNNWDLFMIKRPMSYKTIARSFIGRPDLLSLSIFGKMNYWWIIMKCNPEIQDMWNDINIGDVIQVPDVRDIEDFYSAVQFRRGN